MFGDNSTALLAMGIMLVAVLSVAALWLWWTSGRDDEGGEAGQHTASGDDTSAPVYPSLDEPMQGSFIERLRESLKPLIPKSGVGLPARAAPNPPTYMSSSGRQTLDTEAVEVVRVLRDLADGSLMVEVGGVRYRSMEQVADQTVARRLIGNAQELAQFVGMDTSGEVLVLPPAATSPPPQEPRATSRVKDGFVPALVEEQPSTESVADAINEILQMRLESSEEFTGRTMRIDDSPDGGVLIEIDGVRYETVADISEEPVREFIRSIIREWESEE